MKIIPNIGLGIYRLNNQQAYQSVRWALDLGYQHIDTATLYGNEKAVGQAIKDSKINRDQLFITTKIPLKTIRQKQLKQAIELNNLYNFYQKSVVIISNWRK